MGIQKQPESIEGYWSLLASAFAFSLMTVCVKNLDKRIPISEIVLVRSVISILITRLMLKKAGISPWGNNKKLLFIRGLLGTCALFCVFEAIGNLPLATATVIQYTYPTFTALLALFVLKEGIGRRVALAVTLGWTGITLIVQPEWLFSNTYNIQITAIYIALAGAFLTALAYISIRRLSKSEHQLVIVHYFPLISIPICIPLVYFNGILPQATDCMWLLGVGVLTQLGQVWLTNGFSLLPAAKASSISYIQVIFATIWGLVFFAEKPDIWTVVGSIMIFTATIISLSAQQKPLKYIHK